MSKKMLAWGFLFFLVSATVFADQAAWIEKSDADKAAGMLGPGTILRSYCAPCGDTAWMELPVSQAEVTHREGGFYEVEVNGKGIDLAYIYIEKNGLWRNLAMILGIAVQDVPEFLPDLDFNKIAPSLSAPKNEKNLSLSVPKSEEIHLIDKIVNQCLEKDNSTLGMTTCLNDGYKLWDAELNKVYNQLRVNLKPAEQKTLKAAQAEWIKYRDAEFAFKISLYDSLQGTMYKVMNAEDRLEIVKKRTSELESYLKLLKE
ncbi:MAG: hypothetical protein BWK80_35985 [Desulfobacteraceae bacterium IS3]|nr:MAG: hypothetical protein BWK80_35985 [Desulfobacteraceae bacterium IS3]